MWGSAGTGKTLILMEALKIKLSKLLSQGRKVRVLATTYYDENRELLKKFSDKYLVNMKNIEVMELRKVYEQVLFLNRDEMEYYKGQITLLLRSKIKKKIFA